MTPETEPLREDEGKDTTFSTRLPAHLVERMDARRNSLVKPLSRNAWLEKTIEWVLTNLPTGLAHPERDRVATEAPDEVTGTHRLPPAPHQHRWTVVRDAKGPTGEKLCPDCGEIRQPALKSEPAF